MSEAPSDILTLILQPDNPCNTTIVDSDTGKLLYQVATEHEAKSITRVKNAAGETIASWEWRDVRSDLITLGNRSPTSVSAWLKKSMIPFKDTVTFQDSAGRAFKWKGNSPGLAFELYSSTDKSTPIARFHKSRRLASREKSPSTESSPMIPARLILDSRAEEIQDLVVTSFLVLEKSRRTIENSTMNRADAMALQGRIIS